MRIIAARLRLRRAQTSASSDFGELRLRRAQSSRRDTRDEAFLEQCAVIQKILTHLGLRPTPAQRPPAGDPVPLSRDGKIQYALTGFSAAARLAPMVRYQRVTAYVNEDPGDLVKTLGLKEVSSGANVTLLSPYDEGVFYGAADINGIRIVSSVQAYLDLIGYRGRGEEAATFLLEQVIQHRW